MRPPASGSANSGAIEPNRQDSVLYPRRIEFRHRPLADLETLRLDKVPRVGRNLVELVLQFRHEAFLRILSTTLASLDAARSGFVSRIYTDWQ